MTNKQRHKSKMTSKKLHKIYNETGKETITGQKFTYRQWKTLVRLESKRKNIGILEAAKKVSNNSGFKSAGDRSRENFIEGIKSKYKGDWKTLVQYNKRMRNKGKFTSVKSNLKWDKERNGYVLGDRYFVDVTNSPEGVYVYDLWWE